VAVVLLVVGLSSCTSEVKKNFQAWEGARAKYNAALVSLGQGKTRDAHDQFEACVSEMIRLRRLTSHPYEDPPGPGPVIAGKTAQAWEVEWTRGFKDAIGDALPDLRARTDRGELDWLDVRATLTAYRPDLDEEWQKGIASAAAGQLQRIGEQYRFVCGTATAEDVCDAVARSIKPRLARPFTTERALTGASDKGFGEIRVEVQFDRWRAYSELKDPQRSEVYSLPAVLTVRLTVQTNGQPSSWDGTETYFARIEPPEVVTDVDMNSIRERHFEALQKAAFEKLAARPAQTL
jgi:hypothetical protein